MNKKLYNALKQLPLTKEQRVELQDTIVEVIKDATKIPTIDSTYDRLNINDLFETNEQPNQDNIRVIDKNKSKELTDSVLKTLNINLDYFNSGVLSFRNFNKKTITPFIRINDIIYTLSWVYFYQEFTTNLVLYYTNPESNDVSFYIQIGDFGIDEMGLENNTTGESVFNNELLYTIVNHD